MPLPYYVNHHHKLPTLLPLQFTEHGIEAVIPPELLPGEVRAKIHGKNPERLRQKGSRRDDDAVQGVPPSELPVHRPPFFSDESPPHEV